MKLSKRLLMLTPLASLLVASPLAAQDDDWFDDDATAAVEEKLYDLQDLLTYSLDPNLGWFGESCDDEDKCDIRVIFDDGTRTVIVNGDTVSGSGYVMPHFGSFGYRFGPGMGPGWHGPRLEFKRDHIIDHPPFADRELLKLERQARKIARKARQAEGSEKSDLEKELDKTLNEIFDYKLEHEKADIDRVERHLAEMKEHQSKRESARDDIIKNRKDELLGNERYLEW